jgi:hypothetical protein
LTEYKLFTKPLNALKTTFAKWHEQIPGSLARTAKEAAMSTIIRVIIVLVCAYAGSVVAGAPDPYQTAQK